MKTVLADTRCSPRHRQNALGLPTGTESARTKELPRMAGSITLKVSGVEAERCGDEN